ncbi:uncharacterized protein LOC122307474 [Carya illinoinensis]|uniref:uncharacterized protein LOC122307474 n=1 Tax=Carya illinoinensis TaxID=32201 RepID=UPI001C725A68|nr:uncharacterized protein LOC122307474 [Carya illinoinensis]
MVVWDKLNSQLKGEEVELVACIMRKIWLRRNSLLFEKKFDDPRNIIKAASYGLREFVSAQRDQQKAVVKGSNDRRITKWEKPAGWTVKVNWDAAVDAKNRRVGAGVVIRDSEGELLACLCSICDHVQNPLVAEALALRRAAILSVEMSFSSVILEGDSQLIVNAVNSDKEIWAEYGNIIEDVRKVLLERPNWGVKFVYRESNGITHKLAKLAFTFTDERVWIEECPVDIIQDIQKEKYCNG